MDYEGKANSYDLVLTCSDLIVQKNIRNKKVVPGQEEMTEPENIIYHLVKGFGLPPTGGPASMTGLSNAYD